MIGRTLGEGIGDGNLPTQIGTVVTAVIAGITALRVSRRDSDVADLRTLRRDVANFKTDLKALSRYSFLLERKLAEHGITDVPQPPHLLTDTPE